MEATSTAARLASFFSNKPIYAHIIGVLILYKYTALIVLTVFEGPVVMMLAGLFLHSGFLDFWPAYLALMAGDLIADTFWYGVGRHFGDSFVRRFGRFFSVRPESVEKVKKIFNKYDSKILIASKLTTGLGFAIVTLIVAGMSKVPFRKYLTLNAVGQIFWTGGLMAVGFYLGRLFEIVAAAIGKLTASAFLVIVLFGLYGFAKYLRGRITQNYLNDIDSNPNI